MSEDMKRNGIADYACLKRHSAAEAYSHDNLFHSVLGLLGVRTTTYDAGLDIFAKCPKPGLKAGE